MHEPPGREPWLLWPDTLMSTGIPVTEKLQAQFKNEVAGVTSVQRDSLTNMSTAEHQNGLCICQHFFIQTFSPTRE